MREIKSQPVGRDQRTLLLHVRTEHLTQSGMQQVRRRVIERRGPAPLTINARVETVAELQERYHFRFPLPDLIKRRMANPRKEAAGGEIITDDFAPVNLYDTIGNKRQRKK